MSEPRALSSSGLVRLVAGREISTRVRDKTFVISSIFIIVLVFGAMAFQVLIASNASKVTIGVVGDRAVLQSALQAQSHAIGLHLTVTGLADRSAARAAVSAGDVDAAVVDGTGEHPELLVQRSADDKVKAVVQGAVGQLAVGRQLAQAGITLDVPRVDVTTLKPQPGQNGQRIAVAIIGVVILYTLLVLFGQFVAQGVVEEKSTRVVELLLATMRPWQLLAGKILGLGLLGFAQVLAIAVVGTGGALAFHVVSLPGQLIGTVGAVVAWFVLGYALYAALFAAGASLVSRQEDLPSVISPLTVVLVVSFFIALQAARNPTGSLATITSYIPGMSPVVMPVRIAAGEVLWWQVVAAVVLQVLAIGVVVRIGGRVYAGALLQTGGRIRIRQALQADAV